MLIFLYGEDDFRSRRKLHELKEKFKKDIDPSGHSLIVLDGETATLEQLNEAIRPVSLLARRRMIVIENLFNSKRDIFSSFLKYCRENKLETADENSPIIVLLEVISPGGKLAKDKAALFAFLAGQKYSQVFNPLSNSEAAAWLKAGVEKRGGKIQREAVNFLTSWFGSDLWRLNNEIEKLLNYKAGRQLDLKVKPEEKISSILIEVQDIKELAKGEAEENIFALTDALSGRELPLALKLLEELFIAGLAEEYLLHMIRRQFGILLQIREALDQGWGARKITGLLKLPGFIVQKGINQARNFKTNFLKEIIYSLARIDFSNKTGGADFKASLISLIVRAGREKNKAL